MLFKILLFYKIGGGMVYIGIYCILLNIDILRKDWNWINKEN